MSLVVGNSDHCNRPLVKGAAYGLAIGAIASLAAAILHGVGVLSLTPLMAQVVAIGTPTLAVISLILFCCSRKNAIEDLPNQELSVGEIQPLTALAEVRERSEQPLSVQNPIQVTDDNADEFSMTRGGRWMLLLVGARKAIGYDEGGGNELDGLRHRWCQENGGWKEREEDESAYRDRRDASCRRQLSENNQRKKADLDRLRRRGNVVDEDVRGRCVVYSPRALYEIYNWNMDLIRVHNINRDHEEETQELLLELYEMTGRIGNAEAGAALFMRLYTRQSHPIPQPLIDLAFGDPRFGELSYTGEVLAEATQVKPSVGIAQIMQLRKTFPGHNWRTIQCLLSYFDHGVPSIESFRRTQALLNELPGNRLDKVYFVENDRLCVASGDYFL